MGDYADDNPEIEVSEEMVIDEGPVDHVPIENVDEQSGYFEEAEVETEEVVHETVQEVSEVTRAPEKEKIVQLPITRIKNLMKLDPDVTIASQDAVVAVAKAAELFVHMLGKEAYKFTKQNKKKTIQKKDITECIAACESLCFLEGTLKDE